MDSLAFPQLVAQTQAPQSLNPLISNSGEDTVYVDVGGLAVALAVIFGALSCWFMAVVFISFALVLSSFCWSFSYN